MEAQPHTPSCDDSRLCAELAGETAGIAFHDLYGGDPPSRQLYNTDHFTVLIDLAPLVEGHLLIVPKWHALSFGQVPPHMWGELLDLRTLVTERVTEIYGRPTILEHGSSSSITFSACVSHAHWHVIPVAVDLVPTFTADGLRGRLIDDVTEIVRLGAADISYILYDTMTPKGLWIYESGLSKRHQYLRAAIAEQIGIPEPEWDWSIIQRRDLLRATYVALGTDWL
jgi:diadenosine tetraphosphate (Ap4A) HIT family hydrolase